MPPVRAFLTSLYLSLGIAILAIGVAGGDLLPELPFVTAFSLLVLGVAYYIEGRWELSLRAANFVGLILAAFLGLWAIFQIVRPPTGLSETLPWPASVLPYLAPVLMILIPAKLLRPKHIGDYWAMQGLGLLAMALACALAMDGLFIIFFAFYSVVFVWSLTAFHLYRELGPELSMQPVARGHWKAIRPAILWAAIAGAAAVPLFWATPRTSSQWELALNTRGQALTGLSDGPLDLNRAGTVGANPEKAFEFYVMDREGRPVIDFPTDQRFRSLQYHNYEAGRWVRNQGSLRTGDRVTSPTDLTRAPFARMPDFGPQTVYIEFVSEPRLIRMAPVADPIAWRGNQFSPIQTRYANGTYRSWIQRSDGTLDGPFDFDDGPRYLQAWIPTAPRGKGPVTRVLQRGTDLEFLTRLPRGVTGIKNYTDQLVKSLVQQGKLPGEVLADVEPLTQHRLPKHHLAVAEAIEQHLAASGEFSYTLDLTRQNKAIDPAEDFLLNTKSGHCQRFATALVLMLRSQGIPSQMVIGYRGCEGRGDGWYDVREDNAHAWVEMLLAVPEEARPHGAPWDHAVGSDAVGPAALLTGTLGANLMTYSDHWQPMRWVTLDPTPVAPADGEAGRTSFLEQAREKWEAMLKALLLAYNRESREEAFAALRGWLLDEDGWFYLVGAGLALAALVAWRRQTRRRTALFIGYPHQIRRMAITLLRAGYHWNSNQTAMEFAVSAGQTLASTPATANVAEIPARVVSTYYASRFGERSVSDDVRREIDGLLDRLAIALRR